VRKVWGSIPGLVVQIFPGCYININLICFKLAKHRAQSGTAAASKLGFAFAFALYFWLVPALPAAAESISAVFVLIGNLVDRLIDPQTRRKL
jgi:hypothetical protein